MPSEEWSLLDDTLATALEMPEGERMAYLRRRLADHPDALRQAESMLARAAEAEAFFDASPVAAIRLAPGLRLGPWRLERELGRGGMGVVWLAARADGQAEMRAAIKFLNAPFAAPQQLERFQREKRILARLDHPHIAKLLDAGIGPGEVPNFVLEYVDGPPLTEACQSLDLRARVRLARQVLDALQHAHTNLVVHRDLKPGNILTTAAGVPKLLDFGIARLVEDTAAEARTETLFRVLSIDYASPEQIRGEPLSTASDLYSAGLVFHEVFTGARPRQWARRPLAEVLAEAHDFRLPAHAALPPDLAAILDKATAQEPERRYASASEFSADLGRFLEGLPVAARPAGWWYLASRHLRRHAVLASAAALALTGILAGAGAAVYQAREADRQRVLALAQKREAEAAAAAAAQAEGRAVEALDEARAQRTLADERREDLLRLSYSFLDETYNDIANLPGATPVRAQLLARTLAHLERLQSSSPDEAALLFVSIDALGTLADTYGGDNANLGDRKQARALLDKRAQLIGRLTALQPETPDLRRLQLDNRLRSAVLQASGTPPGYQKEIRRMEPDMDRLVATAPPSRPLYRTAVSYYFRRARLPQDNAESFRYYQRVAALSEEEERRFGGDEGCWRAQALAHKYTASLFPIASDESYRYVRKALLLDEKRVAANPANAQARIDLTFSQSGVATYYALVDRVAEARDMLLEVARQRTLLIEIDPQNRWYRNSLWYPVTWAASHSALLEDWTAVEEGLARLETLAKESSAPAYARMIMIFLRGELARNADPPAGCEAFLEVRRLLDAATPAEQRQYGTTERLQNRLADCAKAEGGSSPAREAP